MGKGGARPGAGRKPGSGKRRSIIVDLPTPAFDTKDDWLSAVMSDPSVIAEVERDRGFGRQIPQRFIVEISTMRVPTIKVRPYIAKD